jgi:transcriptional regulator with XRE-family HTH domain
MEGQVAAGAFGRLLRYWRQVRKYSQEDVALEIESSIKHISFLENGRSLPSRDIALRLATFLKLNSRETNNLLVSAGFAACQIVKPNSIEESFLNHALISSLRGLDPYPSVVINRTGDVYMMNRAWMEILGQRVPSIHKQPEFNILDLLFAEDGLKPYMDDWEEITSALLVSIQQEVLMFQDIESVSTLQRFLCDKSLPADWKIRGANRLTLSGMYTRISLPDHEPQVYLQVFNTVGATRVMPEPALMIYSIYPEDQKTAELWGKRLAKKKKYKHPLLKY